MPNDMSLFIILPAMWYWVIAITDSDGPLDIFLHLREARFIGGLFSCYICLSIWVAGAMFSLQLFAPALLAISAIAGLFVAVYRVINFFGDALQLFQDEQRLSIADRLVKQIDDNTSHIEEFRDAVYEAYVSGYDLQDSFALANQKWGDDAE